MPRKMSGIAISVIEASSVASSTPNVVFDRGIHLYRSDGVPPVRGLRARLAAEAVTTGNYTGKLISYPVVYSQERDRRRGSGAACQRLASGARPADPPAACRARVPAVARLRARPA